MLGKPEESSQVRSLAVAIRRESPEQMHLGLLLRLDSGELKQLHLGWHNLFSFTEYDGKFFWIKPSISDRALSAIVDWLEVVYEQNGNKIPYSVIYTGDDYWDAGRFSAEAGFGFTCATFVVEAFRKFRYDLIDRNTWPHRVDDKIWAKNILCKNGSYMPMNHLLAQLTSLNYMVRFRPEEVAGAALIYGGVPVKFDDAEKVAKKIVSIL